MTALGPSPTAWPRRRADARGDGARNYALCGSSPPVGPAGGTTPRERQEPRPPSYGAGTSGNETLRAGASPPAAMPDARAQVGHQRDAGPAAAEGVRDPVLRAPDVRHPVEREPDVAAPRVLDPVPGELRVDLQQALPAGSRRSCRSTSAGTRRARRRSSGGPRTRASSTGSSSCRRTSGPWARARGPASSGSGSVAMMYEPIPMTRRRSDGRDAVGVAVRGDEHVAREDRAARRLDDEPPVGLAPDRPSPAPPRAGRRRRDRRPRPARRSSGPGG